MKTEITNFVEKLYTSLQLSKDSDNTDTLISKFSNLKYISKVNFIIEIIKYFLINDCPLYTKIYGGILLNFTFKLTNVNNKYIFLNYSIRFYVFSFLSNIILIF